MTHTPARLRRAALLATALVAVAAPASAHVTVSSPDATQGGFGKAVFRVPNESEKASVDKVVITLPADTPFAFVSAGTKPGWTVDVAEQKLDQPTKVGEYELTKAVRTVTWTATGDGIPVGEFDEFALSGGPFPDAKVLSFAAQENYSDGESVDWDEPQTGDQEPEHPAPTLTLAAATTDDHGSGAATGDDDGDGDSATSTKVTSAAGSVASDDDSDTELGTWLGGGALVVALAALVVALRQNRRRA